MTNTIFKSLPAFYNKLKKEKGDKLAGRSFISGQPGSFYGRLFPSKSLHFVHASNSVHWLSQVPKGISNNKGNIFMAKSSPPSVLRAYTEQFHRDFSNFLSLRGEEIMPGGRMLLAITGRSVQDPTCNDCCKHWELLGKSLMDLAAEGIVEEKDVDSFNLPIYRPYGGEVSEIIQEEGSFGIEGLETFELNWDPNDNIENREFVFNKNSSGRSVADWTRAEPILASHFGGAII
ncbi:hypothetical protein F2P56_014361 [Juglans regia]|uniref:Salicylate carboxymethyltransferase-like n=1 Tax=Juglans regia TaxID=51240 RepID=A0A833XCQ2_JUGRE|nr:hypothetical protein F2P56_014361 [Juglans regia]